MPQQTRKISREVIFGPCAVRPNITDKFCFFPAKIRGFNSLGRFSELFASFFRDFSETFVILSALFIYSFGLLFATSHHRRRNVFRLCEAFGKRDGVIFPSATKPLNLTSENKQVTDPSCEASHLLCLWSCLNSEEPLPLSASEQRP